MGIFNIQAACKHVSIEFIFMGTRWCYSVNSSFLTDNVFMGVEGIRGGVLKIYCDSYKNKVFSEMFGI